MSGNGMARLVRLAALLAAAVVALGVYAAEASAQGDGKAAPAPVAKAPAEPAKPAAPTEGASTSAAAPAAPAPAAASGASSPAASSAASAAPAAPAVSPEAAQIKLLVAQAKQLIEKSQDQEAEAALAKALKIDPKSRDALVELARLQSWTERVPLAVETLRKVLAGNPADIEAGALVAECLLAQGKKDDAVKQMNDTIARNPKSAEPHVTLGLIYTRSGKPKEAGVEYQKAIAMDPTNASAYYNLGVLQFGEGEQEKALASFLKAASLDNRNIDAYGNAGQLYYEMGKFAEAREQWLKADKIDPNNFETLRRIVQSYYGEAKYAEADPYREKILKIYAASKDPEAKGFTVDQFKLGDLTMVVDEAFVKQGTETYYIYTFQLYNANRKFVRSVNLESSAALIKAGTPYVLAGELVDGSRPSYGVTYQKVPDYAELKKAVLKVIKDNPTTTAKKPGGN